MSEDLVAFLRGQDGVLGGGVAKHFHPRPLQQLVVVETMPVVETGSLPSARLANIEALEDPLFDVVDDLVEALRRAPVELGAGSVLGAWERPEVIPALLLRGGSRRRLEFGRLALLRLAAEQRQ